MEYLLDTHILLWYIDGSVKLSKAAIEALQETNSRKFVSIATFWEIAIKVSKEKLILTQPFDSLAEYLQINGFELLPIKFETLTILKHLPYHHADPFDRMLIAQAQSENLTILSADRHFASYPINVIW